MKEKKEVSFSEMELLLKSTLEDMNLPITYDQQKEKYLTGGYCNEYGGSSAFYYLIYKLFDYNGFVIDIECCFSLIIYRIFEDKELLHKWDECLFKDGELIFGTCVDVKIEFAINSTEYNPKCFDYKILNVPIDEYFIDVLTLATKSVFNANKEVLEAFVNTPPYYEEYKYIIDN